MNWLTTLTSGSFIRVVMPNGSHFIQLTFQHPGRPVNCENNDDDDDNNNNNSYNNKFNLSIAMIIKVEIIIIKMMITW